MLSTTEKHSTLRSPISMSAQLQPLKTSSDRFTCVHTQYHSPKQLQKTILFLNIANLSPLTTAAKQINNTLTKCRLQNLQWSRKISKCGGRQTNSFTTHATFEHLQHIPYEFPPEKKKTKGHLRSNAY